jgi:hypothetical protein
MKENLSYYEKLPRKINKKRRCQALDEDGNRCKKQAKMEIDIHYNPELYEYPTWGVLYFCEEHFKKVR